MIFRARSVSPRTRPVRRASAATAAGVVVVLVSTTLTARAAAARTDLATHYLYIDHRNCTSSAAEPGGIDGFAVTAHGLVPLAGSPVAAGCSSVYTFNAITVSRTAGCLFHLENNGDVASYRIAPATGGLTGPVSTLPVADGTTTFPILATASRNGDVLFVTTSHAARSNPGGALISVRIGRACDLRLAETLPVPSNYIGPALAGPTRLVFAGFTQGHPAIDVYQVTDRTHLHLLASNPTQTGQLVDDVAVQQIAHDEAVHSTVNVYAADVHPFHGPSPSGVPPVEGARLNLDSGLLTALPGSPATDPFGTDRLRGYGRLVLYDASHQLVISVEPDDSLSVYGTTGGTALTFLSHVTLPPGSLPQGAAELGDTLYVLNTYDTSPRTGSLSTCAIQPAGVLSCTETTTLTGASPGGIATF